MYDKGEGSTITSATFSPHNYYTPKLERRIPYGSIDGYAFDFLSGWKSNDMSVAWVSDMAVILLASDVGSVTGTLGYAYNASGYAGEITAAGYPGETVRKQVREGGEEHLHVVWVGGDKEGFFNLFLVLTMFTPLALTRLHHPRPSYPAAPQR